MPGKIFTAQWLQEGIFPLWNPYLFSGISWLGDTTQSILYPTGLLWLVFHPATALNLNVILHLLLAYSGMYLLARHWLRDHAWGLVAAVLWMFSTQMTGSINNLATLQSLAWLPLISFFGLRLIKERRFQAWFALAVLLQFLGGYPQHVLYSILLAVLLSAFQHWRQISFKRWLSPWLITGVFTLGITAVSWVPLVDFLLKSTRAIQTETQALVGSLHPVTTIKFVLPYFFDHPAHGIKWGPTWNWDTNAGIYLGWLGWLAIGGSLFLKKLKKPLRREVKFFAIVTLLTLLFSLGQNLPGFGSIQKIIPLFRIARYPSMMMLISSVILVLWTARALQNLSFTKLQKQWLQWLGLAALGVGLIGWGLQRFSFLSVWQTVDRFASFSLSQSLFHTADRDKMIMFEIVRNIVFNSLFFLAAFKIFLAKKLPNKVWWLALIIGIDLALNTHGKFFFAPRDVYRTDSEQSQQLGTLINLPPTAFQQRLLTRNSNRPYTDYNSYWEALAVREPFSDSFVDSEGLRTFDHAKNLRDGSTPDWNLTSNLPLVNGYTTLLPQDYAALWNKEGEPRINFIDYVAPDSELLDQWAVKYYLVDTWFEIEEDLSSFPLVAEYDRWQLLARPDALTRFRFADSSPAEMTSFTEHPDAMSFVLNNVNNQGSLLIADRFDPDWRATLNDQPSEIINHQGMRLIHLEPGENAIRLWYWPQWFYLGLAVSGFSGGLLAIYQRFGQDS